MTKSSVKTLFTMDDSLLPNLDDILAAKERVRESCLRTPLIPFYGNTELETDATKVSIEIREYNFPFFIKLSHIVVSSANSSLTKILCDPGVLSGKPVRFHNFHKTPLNIWNRVRFNFS